MFENEYLMNRTLIKEYVLKIIGKKMIIVSIFLFLSGTILFFLEETLFFKYFMLFGAFLGLFSLIAYPIIMINNFDKSSKRLNNGKIEKTHVTFDKNIIMDEGKVHLEFEYSQILKIMQSPNFIALKIGDQSAILVHKEGFIKGSKDDFIKFINDKINIKK